MRLLTQNLSLSHMASVTCAAEMSVVTTRKGLSILWPSCWRQWMCKS